MPQRSPSERPSAPPSRSACVSTAASMTCAAYLLCGATAVTLWSMSVGAPVTAVASRMALSSVSMGTLGDSPVGAVQALTTVIGARARGATSTRGTLAPGGSPLGAVGVVTVATAAASRVALSLVSMGALHKAKYVQADVRASWAVLNNQLVKPTTCMTLLRAVADIWITHMQSNCAQPRSLVLGWAWTPMRVWCLGGMLRPRPPVSSLMLVCPTVTLRREMEPLSRPSLRQPLSLGPPRPVVSSVLA